MTPLPHIVIAEALSQSNLFQKEAARHRGISPQYLSEIIQGKRKISIPHRGS